MQTVLITGANGFVGHYLAKALLHVYKVVATGRGSSRLSIYHQNFTYQELDFTNEEAVKEILKGVRPNVVVHAGAMSKPDECEVDKEAAYLTNVAATKHLLKHAGDQKSFFIFLSTDFVFDGEKGMYSEDDDPRPVNYYGVTKLEAENAVKNYSFRWSIVRTVLVYGNPQGGRQNILTLVAQKLQNSEAYKVFDDQVRTPTYVEDLVSAVKTIIDKRADGVYHISGRDVLTPYGMAVATAKHLGLDEKLIIKATAQDFQQPALRPPKTGFSISKAEIELNYKPISFEEGLRKTFEEI